MNRLVIKNATIITMNRDYHILDRHDIFIENGIINKIEKHIPFSPSPDPANLKIIDGTDKLVCPSFIQTHVHSCQTLFRGYAENLDLLSWLKKRIWPFESAHTYQSLFVSSLLSGLELLHSGTTTILDMGTVHHTDAIFEAYHTLGMRAIIGNTLMDQGEVEPSYASLFHDTLWFQDESQRLFETWHQKHQRLLYAVSPRFVLSCSEQLLQWCVEFSKKNNILLHTHAAENPKECDAVKQKIGMSDIEYYHRLGFLSHRTAIAHGVWLNEIEQKYLADTHTSLIHCPSTNLKLASGIAPITTYKDMQINLGIGCDGAPCNNQLNIFNEIKLAGLLQKPRFGPNAMPAREVVRMATLDGAKLLGLENSIGSLEVGKSADILIIDPYRTYSFPVGSDPYTYLVYQCQPQNISHLFVSGKCLIENQKLLHYDAVSVIDEVKNLENHIIQPLLKTLCS